MSSNEKETPLCPPRCSRERVKRCCTTWNIYWAALVWFALVTTYLLVGGGLFFAAERPNEEDEIEEASREREAALGYLQETFVNLTNGSLSEEDATALVDELAVFFDRLGEIPAESSPQWEYGPSVFFASTVITTIGYGNIAPVTAAGRTIFVFYALCGIPMTLVFLGTLGKILSNWLEQILAPIVHKYPSHAGRIRTFGLLGAAILGAVTLVFIPSIIFSSLESWTYGESLYYCVVTLTTVGFGDFVPGQESGGVNFFYRLCSAAWIWIGLAYVALVISNIQTRFEKVGDKVREARRRRKAKKVELEEEGNTDTAPTEDD